MGKSDVKKVDNVKVLKDKVKLMKKKLKTLLDTVAMKDKAILDIKEKFSTKIRKPEDTMEKFSTKKRRPEDTVDQVSTKRKSTRLSSTHAQKGNGVLKENLTVGTKSRKVSDENIFSPR